MDSFLPTLSLDSLSPLFAAGGIAADRLPVGGWLTNSIFVAVIVLLVVLLFTRMATKEMALIPGAKQNFVEFVIEFLYGQVEQIVGEKLAPKSFPILATIFIFILVSNYSGLIPGVGTVGFGHTVAPLTLGDEAEEVLEEVIVPHGIEEPEHKEAADSHAKEGDHTDHAEGGHGNEGDHGHHFTPLLRPPTADLNMTLGLAVVFMFVWVWITFREIGFVGFLEHTFAPKGGVEGALKWGLVPIFFFVGVIEMISIVFRPISLSFRLLGNIFAGETLLHTMGSLGSQFTDNGFVQFILGVIMPLPFYFMELLVGLLQAVVFTLLCAVYIQLSTSHDEDAH